MNNSQNGTKSSKHRRFPIAVPTAEDLKIGHSCADIKAITESMADMSLTKLPVADPALEYKITENEKNKYDPALNTEKRTFASAEAELDAAGKVPKLCNKCRKTLPLSYFPTNTCGTACFDRDGLRYRRGECIPCGKGDGKGKAKAIASAKKEGLPTKPPEGTCCELCKKTEKIVFDHDHTAETFRGWLCDPCNRSIGVLGESPERLLQVVLYLTKKNKPVQEILLTAQKALSEL